VNLVTSIILSNMKSSVSLLYMKQHTGIKNLYT